MTKPKPKFEKVPSNIGGELGVTTLDGKDLDIDLSDSASVERVLHLIADAQASGGDDTAKHTALWLKAANVGFVAALADCQRQDLNPGETIQAATNAYAQQLAFFIGLCSRASHQGRDHIKYAAMKAAAESFLEVFCNMFASISEMNVEAVKNKIEARKREGGASVPSVKRTVH